MAITRPRVMVGHHGDLVGREHVQHFYTRFRRLLRVGVEGELHPRLLHQQDLVVGEVGEEGKRFALRADHEDVVTHGVSGRGHGLNAGQEFLAVLVEDQPVAHGHQVLAGVYDEILPLAAHLAFVGPIVEIALRDIKLRVREQHLAAVIDHAADMIDMPCENTTASMSPGAMPASAMLFCWRPVVGPNAFEVPMPGSNSTSLSPVLPIGEFDSSTIVSGDRKLSVSIFLISSSGAPTKVPLGGPSGSGPSETTVTSALPRLNR